MAITTINALQQIEFFLSVKRLPNVSFRASRVVIPGMSMNAIERPTPFKKLYETSDTITYGDFNVTFTLDENLETYFEISKWMKGVAFPGEFSQYDNLNKSTFGLRSDISVNMLTSKKNNNFVMTVNDCFPTAINEITLDSTNTEAISQEMNVTFAYNGFTLEKA